MNGQLAINQRDKGVEAADETRTRLIHAAGEIFAEKGFRSATVREICDRARANVAAVNYHFGDKEGLYQIAVQEAHCCPAELQNPNWPESFGLEEKLRFFVTAMLSSHLDKGRPEWHARLMLRELSEPTAACAKLVEAYIRPSAGTLWNILGDVIPAGTDQVQVWLTGFSIVGQCLFYKINEPIASLLMGPENYDKLRIEQLAEHITQFSLAAIGKLGQTPIPGAGT